MLPLIWIGLGAIGTAIAKHASDKYSDKKAEDQAIEFELLKNQIEAEAREAQERFFEFSGQYQQLQAKLLSETASIIEMNSVAECNDEKAKIPEKIEILLENLKKNIDKPFDVGKIAMPSTSSDLFNVMKGGINIARFASLREIGAGIAMAAAVVDSARRLNTVLENQKLVVSLRETREKNLKVFLSADQAYKLEIDLMKINFEELSEEIKLMISSGMYAEANRVAEILRGMN